MLVFVYLFIFVILYIRNKRFRSPVLNFVLVFYILASCAAIITHVILSPECYHTVLSVSFHLFVLYLFIHPIIQYGKLEGSKTFRHINDRRFIILAYSLIGLQAFSIIFFSAEVYAMLVRGDFAQIRSEILMAGRGTGSLPRTVAGVASFYYCYNIILFYYSLAYRRDKTVLLILLIVTSASKIIHSLTYMGRDGILFWILSFVSGYFIFMPYLNNKTIAFLRRVFFFIGGVAILLLGAISLSRFGESENGVWFSLVDYFGQPINNFGIMFDRFHDYTGTKSVLPLLFGERGISGSEVLNDFDSFFSKYGFYNNSFKTFVGNFYMAWGPIVTIVIAIIYNHFMTLFIKKTSFNTIPIIIVLFISIQIVVHNYFYWAYYIRAANLFLFTIPVFLIWCKKAKAQPENLKNISR